MSRIRKQATRRKPIAPIETVPLPEFQGTVRVTLPAKVAYDLKAFQKVQASILDRFGCPNCHSGLDIRYDVIRSFAVDEKLNLIERVGGVVVTEG